MKTSAMAMTLLLCSASNAQSGEAVHFEAPTLDGDTVRLADYRGRVVVVDFWATWCPPCRKQLPMLSALEKQVDDIVVLAVCVDKRRDNIDEFAARVNLPQRVLLDPEGKLAQQFDVQAMPWTVLIDPEGRVVWQQASIPADIETTLLDEVRKLQSE
jgi:peroxiredoxin